MKHHFIHKAGNCGLVLFFGGWGSGPSLFQDCRIEEGYDCLFCYDYRDMTFDMTLIGEYPHIRILAWSMGVAVADRIFGRYIISGISGGIDGGIGCGIGGIDGGIGTGINSGTNIGTGRAPDCPSILSAVAVGGTLFPADDRFGIPANIFYGTLENMSEPALAKFRRRMCGKHLQYYMEHLPDRAPEELKNELQALSEMIGKPYPGHLHWNLAIVGNKDLIFPPANQAAAWLEGPDGCRADRVVNEDAAHYDPELFDRLLDGRFPEGGFLTE